MSHILKTCDPDYPNVSKMLPINLRIAESKKGTILRIVTRGLAIDMKGVSLLCEDIETAVLAFVTDKEHLPFKSTAVDVYEAIMRYLSPKMQELENFWHSFINFEIKPITLGKDLQTVDARFCRLSRVTVPANIFESVRKFAAKQGISLYELFMSMYKLYLHFGSKVLTVTVGTGVDMRPHVQEHGNVITGHVNYIPIIAQINPRNTLSDLVQTNCLQISTITKHGTYPSTLILKNLRSREPQKHCFRHFLTVNETAEKNRTTKDPVRAEIKRVLHVRSDCETFVDVTYDLRNLWMNLDIGYNSKICGRFGQTLPDKLMWLVDQAMNFGNKTIENLEDEMLTDLLRFKEDKEEIKERTKSIQKAQQISCSNPVDKTQKTEYRKVHMEDISHTYSKLKNNDICATFGCNPLPHNATF